jgi:hypothetical protein
MPQAALAAAQFVGSVLSGSAFGGGFAGALAQTAAIAAINAGVSSIVRRNTGQRDQGSMIALQLDPSAPRRLVIGKRATGGVLVDWYLSNNNIRLYLPIYLSEGPCNRITRVWAGGREVWSTPLSHGVKTEITSFRSGGPRLWLTFYDGRPGQSADGTLTGLAQGWTSANTMTRCCYVVAEMWWDSDNLRTPPELVFELEGAKLYDRRQDTWAGGSGAQRYADAATWQYTDNPAVALDHFRMGWLDGAGGRVLGLGRPADDWPYADFAARANICDEDVALKAGGTQKRYRANGFLFASDTYADTITKLCTAMASRPADFGGRFGVVGIESKTPVMIIDDADCLLGAPEVYTPKRSWSALVGAVEGRFQDPAQLYQPVDFPRVTDAAWATEDGGEATTASLDLEFETDVERAQRLALLKARAERRQATLQGRYPLWTVELERGDWYIRTGPKWGEDGKTFEVLERIYDPTTHTVQIVGQEVDPADSAWDENVAQAGPPAPLSSTGSLSDLQSPSLTVTAQTISGAAASVPTIRVVWASPTDTRVREIFVEVVRQSDGLQVAAVTASALNTDRVIVQNGIVDGVSYSVRARFLSDRIVSAWSSTTGLTSGSVYNVGAAATVNWAGVTGSGKPDDFATKNTVYVQGTAPSSPTNGDLWLDTSATPFVWKVRQSGAWQSAASLGGVFGVSVYESTGVAATLAAFKTQLGTAAAITGQGWGATASEDAASNARVPNGRNLLINSDWTNGLIGWRTGANGDSGLPVSRSLATSGFWATTRNNTLTSLTGTPAAGRYLDAYVQGPNNMVEPVQTRRYGVPLVGGERIYASALVARHRFSAVHCIVRFVSADEATVSEVSVGSGGVSGGGVGGEPGNFELVGGFTTAPSWARWAGYIIRGFTDGGADPLMLFTQPFMTIVPASQTTAPPYTSGPPDRKADSTAENTAGAITGQGNFATANFYRQSSDPGGVEGRWWVDTTASQLKLYTGGAWNVIADIGGAFYLTPSHTIRQGFISGGGSVTTPSVTVTQAGATGAVSYRWVLVSGDTFTINSPTSNTTTATTSLTAGQDKIGNYMCIATDAGSGRVSNTIVQFQGTSTS